MQIRIGHNARGTFRLSSNPLQMRFAARAVAHEGQWELMDVPGIVGDCRRVAIKHTTTGEERHILVYRVTATENAPYIRTLDDDGNLDWAKGSKRGKAFTVPKIMQDGNTHLVYSVMVKRPKANGELGAMELSRSCWTGQFVQRYVKQTQELDIQPDNPLYINPLAFIPKDALVAAMAKGTILGIQTRNVSETRALIQNFIRDEERIIAGEPYQPATE